MQVIVLEPVSAYPVLHVNVLTLPVTPALAETVPKLGALKDGHDLAVQAEPVKSPLVSHVQVPPPLYPASQVTATVAPVVPVILERAALFENRTRVAVHEIASQVGAGTVLDQVPE